jgi:acyl-coenzyme A thioesterase PaaI-like protein
MAAGEPKYLLDRLLTMERVLPAPPGTAAVFRASFDKCLLNVWGGVQGGFLMAYIAQAAIEAQKDTPHKDMRHFSLVFVSAPKSGVAFKVVIRAIKRTRSFAFLEGEMAEDGTEGARYIKFTMIFCDFGRTDELDVRQIAGGVNVPGQLVSDWFDPFAADLAGRLDSATSSTALDVPMSNLPSLWDSISSNFIFKDNVFAKIVDLRLATSELKDVYAAQVAAGNNKISTGQGKGWMERNIAVRAGSPDKRPVDPILLSFLAETPTWSNLLLPPSVLKARGPTVSVLSFTLDFFCKVPDLEWLLVRNHHHGYSGDTGVPQITCWNPQTGKLVMVGQGMALTRVPEKKSKI